MKCSWFSICCLCLACGRAGSGTEAPAQAPESAARGELHLPARFESDRIFLELRTADGERLRLYTDTGGGLHLSEHVVERLGLAVETMPGDGGEPIEVAELPALDPSTPMPPVPILNGRLPVLRDDPYSSVFGDGMLGQAWFGDRVWSFDYAREVLSLHAESVVCDEQSVLPLGFLEEDGQRIAQYPRVRVEVDGRELDVLFDTGAMVMLTDRALAELEDGGPRERGTSFIVRSIFDEWRSRHPDWRVIEQADRLTEDPMIEVPSISFGRVSVGPVWFTARADPNFHEFMSQWMDRRIDGAVGGSALRYLQLSIDYPEARLCIHGVTPPVNGL